MVDGLVWFGGRVGEGSVKGGSWYGKLVHLIEEVEIFLSSFSFRFIGFDMNMIFFCQFLVF